MVNKMGGATWTCLFYIYLAFAFLYLIEVSGSHAFDENSSNESGKTIHGHKLDSSSEEDTLYKYVKYKVAHSDFLHGFIASLSMILVSEIGDKTFFIAAIMAMRHSRTIVLAGALGALVAMTILSAMLGYATTIIPRRVTHFASAFLFAIFGLKMLRDGWYMSDGEAQEEYEEVQAEIKKKEDEMITSTKDIETGIIRGPPRNILNVFFSAVFLEAFVLTFLAEWGDRSQIATIILAAREDVWGVMLGGFIGHAICTGLAVIAGRIIAQKISSRQVTLIGGVVFLLFAVSALLLGD